MWWAVTIKLAAAVNSGLGPSPLNSLPRLYMPTLLFLFFPLDSYYSGQQARESKLLFTVYWWKKKPPVLNEVNTCMQQPGKPTGTVGRVRQAEGIRLALAREASCRGLNAAPRSSCRHKDYPPPFLISLSHLQL
jgi:hypothetical protein